NNLYNATKNEGEQLISQRQSTNCHPANVAEASCFRVKHSSTAGELEFLKTEGWGLKTKNMQNKPILQTSTNGVNPLFTTDY
ncbi:MAG: hypothetical protein ACYS8S_05995, partial [Planctomycetota bacterium]